MQLIDMAMICNRYYLQHNTACMANQPSRISSYCNSVTAHALRALKLQTMKLNSYVEGKMMNIPPVSLSRCATVKSFTPTAACTRKDNATRKHQSRLHVIDMGI